MLRHPCSPPGRLLPLYQLIHNHPVSLLLQSVSPLSFLFLLTFLYLPDPSSPPWLPLPSFRGPLIHLLSTQSLINRPTFCLSLCYRHSLSIHLLYALVFHLKLTFFFVFHVFKQTNFLLTAEGLLSSRRQFVCLKASRTLRSIFCVNVWVRLSWFFLVGSIAAVYSVKSVFLWVYTHHSSFQAVVWVFGRPPHWVHRVSVW